MKPVRRSALVLLLATPLAAQDRILEPADLAARAAAAAELEAVLGRSGDLPTTVALAATAGVGLPAGSAARAELTRALQTANGADAPDRALPGLRSDLGDLVAVLRFQPKWEAELPAGFPGFAAVNEIELRSYPRYRMAQTVMRGGSNGAFWPLFRHITSNDIAMTTPVQMDWQAGAEPGRPVNMAFLYGNTTIEPASVAAGVEVVEVPAQTVLSIGAIGDDRKDRVEALHARLRAALAVPGCPWEAAGPMRTMGYNSPMVRRDRRYFEVQLPVRPRHGDV